jgi:hypothetical protein
LRGGDVPANFLGRDFLLGGDLIIQFGAQEACHKECLAEADKQVSSVDQIQGDFLRAEKRLTTVIDVSASRIYFLMPGS